MASRVFGMLFAASVLGVAPFSAFGADQAAAQPTFSKDIAPIFQRACQNCHRPGSIAPMALMTYKDARPWARSIKEKVVRRVMPPWHIDRNVGVTKFKNDPSLTDAEIATISTWVDHGAPEGNAADLPPARRVHATTTSGTSGNPMWWLRWPSRTC